MNMKPVSLKLPDALEARIKRIAEKENRNFQQQARHFLEQRVALYEEEERRLTGLARSSEQAEGRAEVPPEIRVTA